jgi:serine/threonine protein kinase
MIIGNSIELSNQIGNGSYGAVFLGKDINSDELYAVKKISKRLLLSSSTIAYLNNEIYLQYER